MSTITIILQALFDAAMLTVLIFAAISDGKTKKVPWWSIWTSLGIAVVHTVFVFGHFGIKEGFLHLGTGVLMAAIYLIMVIAFKGNGIGGGDSKMTSIVALYLGLWPTVAMMVVHYIAVIIYKTYMSKVKHKTIKSVRLMIFLGIGFLAGIIIEWITMLL